MGPPLELFLSSAVFLIFGDISFPFIPLLIQEEDELNPMDSLTWLKLRQGDYQPGDGQGR